MGFSKLQYALLDLKKKVVIFTYFNVTIYIEFEFLNYQLVYSVNYNFLIRIFTFLASLHIFCLLTIKSYFFLFSSTRFIVVNLHHLNTKQHQYCQYELNLQNPNICPKFPPLQSYLQKKALQMFCVINECDSDSKK